MKTFETLQELLKCDRDMKWTNSVAKMVGSYQASI